MEVSLRGVVVGSIKEAGRWVDGVGRWAGHHPRARRALGALPGARRAWHALTAVLSQASNAGGRQGSHEAAHPVVTWVPPGHYHSPITSSDEIVAGSERIFGRDPLDVPGVDLRIDEQLALLDELSRYAGDIPLVHDHNSGLRYRFDNAYSYSDGIFLNAMLRHLGPGRVVEVGSGFSSALILDTNERFFDFKIECTFIDPNCDLMRSRLKPGDLERIHIVERQVQDAGVDTFAALAGNDVLFIDSSHVSKTGSDVNHIVFEILPMLQSGVFVHFHDVFPGFEYPLDFVMDGRSWNEDYLLRAFLQYNDRFRIVLHNALLYTIRREKLLELFPPAELNPGGSLWIQKL